MTILTKRGIISTNLIDSRVDWVEHLQIEAYIDICEEAVFAACSQMSIHDRGEP